MHWRLCFGFRFGGARKRFDLAGEKSFARKELECGFAVGRFDSAGDCVAACFDRLVAKRPHKFYSPEQTRRTSSTEVTPARVLRMASSCMVTMLSRAASLM